MQRLCVFCGSSPGARPEYVAAAKSLARHLVTRQIGIVYGGGNTGLMGARSRLKRWRPAAKSSA